MESIEQIASVPIITALVFVLMVFYRNIVNEREPFIRLIPALTIFLGIVLGIIAFYLTPELMPASNVFMAALIGSSSGLAATGTHQIYKQLQRNDEAAKVNDAEEIVMPDCGDDEGCTEDNSIIHSDNKVE